MKNFEGLLRPKSPEGKSVLQVVIHSTLTCAAVSSTDHTGRSFTVEAEPIVFRED